MGQKKTETFDRWQALTITNRYIFYRVMRDNQDICLPMALNSNFGFASFSLSAPVSQALNSLSLVKTLQKALAVVIAGA
ncbi:MAG: hypothetical protein K6C41_09295 [Lachnospiraceae bacterium]|nr:hypothetical protein [Lachnospiraceae bacterium]